MSVDSDSDGTAILVMPQYAGAASLPLRSISPNYLDRLKNIVPVYIRGLVHSHLPFGMPHPELVRHCAYPGLANAAPVYGLTANELTAKLGEHNPIERMGILAKAKVPSPRRVTLVQGGSNKKSAEVYLSWQSKQFAASGYVPHSALC